MRGAFTLALLGTSLVAYFGSQAKAADFVVSAPDAHHVTTIYVSGTIERGDDQRFRTALRGVLPLLGIVIVESPGGNLQAGLEIGREISVRAYSTVVKAGAICASACALVWLAGDRRFMAPGARIGFHAAYTEEGDASWRRAPPTHL
jgi:hypothetical protein